MPQNYRIQVASDLQRDGLGVELLLGDDPNPIAEVFRCDKDRTYTINTFGSDVSVSVVDSLLTLASHQLSEFENGAPLTDARQIADWDDRARETLEKLRDA